MKIEPKIIETNFIPIGQDVSYDDSINSGMSVSATPQANEQPEDIKLIDTPDIQDKAVTPIKVDPSLRSYSHDLVFSSSDADTVAWASGTITLADGATFSIDAGNTGDMTARTYIYFDYKESFNALQTSTTFSDAVGEGKILLATAEDATGGAIFFVMGGVGGINIDANSITVANLAAISADLGSITAGNITVDSSGFIQGGQTAYNTGTGFFLGYDTDAYKFSVGDPSGDYFRWTGSAIESSWRVSTFIGGDGSDGDVTLNGGGTTQLTSDMYYDDLTITNNSTLQPDGYRIFVRGTLQIDSGSKIAINGNNGGNGTNGGNAVQGSNSTKGTGGTGGAAVTGNYLSAGEDGKAGGDGGIGVQANNGNPGSAGTAGDATTNSVGVSGVAGGGGGNGGKGGALGGGTGGNGGAAGTASIATHDENEPNHILTATRMYGFDTDGTPQFFQFKGGAGSGGSGGGGGGGGTTGGASGGGGGGGGGAGSTGGVICIICGGLVNNGTIEASGGSGGNGGNGGTDNNIGSAGGGGGGGAGSGGSGGVVVIVTGYKSGSGSVDVSGGSAGTIGSGGADLNPTGGDGASDPGSDGDSGNTGNSGSEYLLYA